ncbi:hypothetical protein HG431_001495 [Candidatus Saccharibacteria bacterium]|nr:hypothetical protein [Candidatus Saccharibacteria bacterium]
MYKRLIAFLMFLALVVLLAITQTTAPSKVGPAIVVVVFVLIYIFLTCTLTLLLLFINKIVSKHKSEPSKRSADDMYTLMYGAVLALAPTVIVAVQSIGQVQAGTYVLITLFVLLALLYVRHQKRVK